MWIKRLTVQGYLGRGRQLGPLWLHFSHCTIQSTAATHGTDIVELTRPAGLTHTGRNHWSRHACYGHCSWGWSGRRHC